MTTTLYRAYDDADRLLYVGISDGVFLRLGQHCGTGWARHAVKVTLARYTDRESAAAAELSAIRNEDPVWNMSGRPIDRFMQWMIAYPNRHADNVGAAEITEQCRQITEQCCQAAILSSGAPR